jgi:P3 major capsid protein
VAKTPAPVPVTSSVTPQQINAMARAAVLASAIERRNKFFSRNIDLDASYQVELTPKNVGLIKHFLLIVEGTITNTHATETAVASPYGIQNILSLIKLVDLNGNERINTSGFHIANINSVKSRWPYGAALQRSCFGDPLESASGDFGANWPVIVNPRSIAAGANRAFRMVYKIPVAYSDDDLRGSIYAGVVNAEMSLEVSVNQNAFVPMAADDTHAVLRGGTLALSNVRMTCYQIFLDQLPLGSDSKPLLPVIDLSTVYELKKKNIDGMIVGEDFSFPFPNFRDFLSVFVNYNSTGGNDGHGVGNDINTWKLQSASFTTLWEEDPLTQVLEGRDWVGVDFPAGLYYFSFRRKPISTVQYGNMDLVMNPSIATNGAAYADVYLEDFAMQNTLTQASSLATR